MPWYKYFQYKTNQELATSEGLTPMAVSRMLAARKESAPTLECGEQCPVCKDWTVLIFGVGDQRICKNCASVTHDREMSDQLTRHAMDQLKEIQETEKKLAAQRAEHEETLRAIAARNVVLSHKPEYIESLKAHDARRISADIYRAKTDDRRACFFLSKTADPYLYSEKTAQLADTLIERWRQFMNKPEARDSAGNRLFSPEEEDRLERLLHQRDRQAALDSKAGTK